MKKVTILLIGIVVVLSCNSNRKPATTNDLIPVCIREEIEAIEKKKVSNPPVQIDEYMYKGKRVFLYTADCCDQFNTLYDENCKAICSPSGGLEGGGDHKCKDFSATAKHVKLIWKINAK